MSVPLEQQLYQGLVATPAFAGLLSLYGGVPALFDKQLPQQIFDSLGGSAPYLAGVFQRISSPRIFAHGAGSLQANTGRARFQFTFWSNAPNGTVLLNAVDDAVRGFFQGFVGVGSPALTNPSFYGYDSRTEIEPQTQPTLQKLLIDVQFWFSE